MNGGESGSEKRILKSKAETKAEITFNVKCQCNYQPLFA